MVMDPGQTHEGLEGVVVANTRLSEVDGERGQLIIAGRHVEQLAGQVSFEEICALLWGGEAAKIRADLGAARVRAFQLLPRLGDALEAKDGMDALRTAIAHLPSAQAGSPGEKEAFPAAAAVFAAAWSRRLKGLEPVAPDPARGLAADYLRMIRGDPGTEHAAAALDAYLVAVSDHGMNASTFTARVVASTGSDMVSAITAAVGALKGPLHGGAPGPVLDMIDGVGAPEKAVAWLEAERAAGRRIMGMGHRIYRVRDPRAAVLEQAIDRLEKSGVKSGRLALARAVEVAATGVLRARYPDRPLRANVEFYTAVVLDAVGLPRSLFSPTFAVARSAGWAAHVDEQRAVGKLIRPASRYVGPMPG